MAEGMMGRFSDYTRSPEGIYDPWAVGINAAMGGYQYGMDRAAQERERTFAEQQRGRTRKDWDTLDKFQQIAKQIEEQHQLPDDEKYFPEDQGPGFPGVSIAPAGTIQSPQLGAVTAPGVSIAPAGTVGAPQLQGAGAAPIAPPQTAAQRRERPFDMRSPRAQRMEADKFRALAMEAQKLDPRLLRDDIAGYREQGKQAYAQYVGAATTTALSALTTGDSAGFERWKQMYPDIARTEVGGYSLGDFRLVGTAPVKAPNGQVVGTNFTLATPDGQQLTLDNRGIHQFAAQIAQDPQFWAAAGQTGEAVTKAQQDWALGVAGQETNAYNAQTNRLIALQQARNAELDLRARLADANSRAQGDAAKAMQETQNMLFKDGEELIAGAVDGAFLPNADGGYAPSDGSAMTVQIVGPDGKLGPAVDARTTVDNAGKQGKPKVVKLGQSFLRGSVRTVDGVVQPMLSTSQAAEYGIIATHLEADMQRGGSGVAELGDGTTVLRTPSEGGWLLWRGRRAQDGSIIVNSAPMPYDYDKFTAAHAGGWLPTAPPRNYLQTLAQKKPAPAAGGMKPPSRAVAQPAGAPRLRAE